MKLGFVSSILDESSFEEVLDTASTLGYECIEVACWPKEKASRRYAGVTHIDINTLSDEKINYIKTCCKNKNIMISSLAYYPNPLDEDLEKREKYISHLMNMITIAPKLNVSTITTFVGRNQHLTIEENLEKFKQIWTPIIKLAEKHKVKIAIENCPMLFTSDQWPGGQNLATTPSIWRKMFDLIQSDYFGLNYDPSHFVWQQMDYISPLYEFKDKIFHVHFKDIKLFHDKLNDVGIMAYPLEYMSPKLPGLGDVNWGKYVSALTDINYKGYACIEIEDKSFEDSKEAILNSLKLSIHYIRQFVV
ncbi:sugar phosphate isomerase/epimerase family protein [Alkalibacter saccharofermentans]|uniref:Sugar phosphate isomerase/epimerase n=1 Tax=Alkalibacter saccharofermentans DSM 14828 TaxID=1120975 RepID=A0A1M4UT73_9FIRM|nr:sugar phosphate isomerase/epimerase family protein [Alkalibacter saccharofermentans]SHE59800.1 Sugar phosphate isomerase/epimerase [Alkalibacter saccharofermentans DSM 14828]